MKDRIGVSFLLGIALAIAACGDGGDGSGGVTTVSGTCDACQTDGDCDEGLRCQPCAGNCSGMTKRCGGFGGADAPQLSCPDGMYAAGCVNIAGTWTVTETLDGSCTIEGETDPIGQSGTGAVTFEQSGCEIRYAIPEVNAERSGVIVGNRARLTGPFLIAQPGANVHFDQNEASVEGTAFASTLDLSGSGHGSGTISGVAFSCTGTSTATGVR